MNWLYQEVYHLWSDWLPKSAHKDLKYSNSYNVLVKPGLRIIAYNSNFCHLYNFWTVVKSDDLGNQLYELMTALHAAEAQREKVYIVSHISPDYCYHSYKKNFAKIIKR